MNFKFILWLILLIINHALGEFLQISLASVDENRILKRISGITITACNMECAKHNLCHSIAVTKRSPNKLPDCLLLKDEDNGFYGAGNEMTTIKAIGYGIRVNGQWGSWRNISACNMSCGGGSLNQSRDCDSPKPQYGGDDCTGLTNRTVKCNEQNCPVHGQWGNWKNTSACTVSCGGGVLNQSRDCDSPKPAHGGNDCTGPSNRTVQCNEQNCPQCPGKFFTGSSFRTSYAHTFATVDKLLQEYKIQFDFKIDLDKVKKLMNRYINIFLLRYKTDADNFRLKGPTLYIYPDTKDILIHTSFEDGNSEQIVIKFNENYDIFAGWVHYEISQKKIGSDYKVEVRLNGKLMKTLVNKYPREIMDMKLYLSGWHNPSAEADIKNFSYEGLCDLKPLAAA